MRDPSPSAAAQDDARLFNTLRLVFPAHRVFPSGATALPFAPHHAFKKARDRMRVLHRGIWLLFIP
jgi:hypothetical protein